MPIATRCPDCGEKYTLADRQAGKKVRCKQCQGTFTVDAPGGSPPPQPVRAAPPDALQAGRRAATNPDDFDLPKSESRDRGRGRDDDHDDYDDDRPRRREGRGSNKLLIWGICSFLGLAVIGVLIFVIVRNSGGSDISNVDEALEAVRSSDTSRRLKGLEWLEKANVDQNALDRVLIAAGPLALDRDARVREAATRVTQRWMFAGIPKPPFPGPGPRPQPQPPQPETVETLLVKVGSPHPHEREDAIRKLGERKELRAAAPIAKWLPDFFTNGHAQQALEKIGAGAEKDVLPFLNHPEERARTSTRKLLQGYGTSDDKLADQCVADLQSAEAARRRMAADLLTKFKPVPAKQGAVAKLLEGLVTGKDRDDRNAGIKALAVWGTADNTPAVAQVLRDLVQHDFWNVEQQKACMEALARWKDPRGAEAIAVVLGNRHHNMADEAEKALRAMGPAGAKAAARQVNHPDQFCRDKVRKLVKELGVEDDVLVVQCVEDMQSKERDRRWSAADWLATANVVEQQRGAVARGLDTLLKDPEHNVQQAAVKALGVWGDKASVPALIAVADDMGFNPHANHMRQSAMRALGKLKDERGVPTIVKKLGNVFDGGAAVDALKDMGPVAEPALLTMLDPADNRMKGEVVKVLGMIGTKASLPKLGLLTRHQDRGLAAAAVKAGQDILQREGGKPGA